MVKIKILKYQKAIKKHHKTNLLKIHGLYLLIFKTTVYLYKFNILLYHIMKNKLFTFFISAILFSSFTFKKEHKSEIRLIQKKDKIERDSIISFAKQYMGTPYLYASNDPHKGFDCSGFVSYVFQHFNINLPRSSSGYKNIGEKLAPDDFKIGDILVFYGYKNKTTIGHVGIIYEANGMQSKFIHASSGKAGSVTISELASEHYSKRFYKCISVLTE